MLVKMDDPCMIHGRNDVLERFWLGWLISSVEHGWMIGWVWISGYDFGIVVNIAVVMPDFQAPVFVCDFGHEFPTDQTHPLPCLARLCCKLCFGIKIT